MDNYAISHTFVVHDDTITIITRLDALLPVFLGGIVAIRQIFSSFMKLRAHQCNSADVNTEP